MSNPHLTFYDTSRAYYASYYLYGFSELKKSGKLHISVAHALPARLQSAVQNADWQHLLFAMILFKYQQGDHEWYFCIDAHDDNSVDAANHSGGYHLPLLQNVDVYFKVNYNPDKIERTAELNIFHEKIHSISQFFPLHPEPFLPLCRRLMLTPALFGFSPGFNYNQPYDGCLTDAKYRLRDLKNFQPFEQILAYRMTPRDIDIFFVTSFRYNPRHEAAMESRYQIMRRIADLQELNTAIGFSGPEPLPEKYAGVSHPRLSQFAYLEILARSRIVIYTQGILGCLSSKFGLAMALGAAVIGEPLGNNPELLVAHPHLREQFCCTDPDEVAEHAIHLATHPEKARELGALNAAMFDHQLAPRPTAEYVLQTLIQF